MYYQDMCDDFYLDERYNYMHMDDVKNEFICRKEVDNKYIHEDDIEKWYIHKDDVKEKYIRKSELEQVLNGLMFQIETLKQEIDSWQTK